jgi:hypothetical protein
MVGPLLFPEGVRMLSVEGVHFMRESEKLAYLVEAMHELLCVLHNRPDIRTRDGVTVSAFIRQRLATIEENNSRERRMLEQWFRSDNSEARH